MVVEGYFDETTKDDLLHLRSGTKSVVSLLIGIAVEQGRLASIDVTLGEVLGERATRHGRDKASLTIRHLLTMTGGLEWREIDDVDEYNQLHRSRAPVALYLSRDRVHPAGRHWAYSSGASHVLSAVLSEVTGSTAAEFAREHLFRPLGIESFRWDALADGHTNGAAGLQLRPRDALTLGQLMLAGGRWEGRQVVPAEWVEDAVRPHTRVSGDTFYGLHWWVEQGEPTPGWMAIGFGGQTLAVLPEHQVVLVANCRWRGLRRPVDEQVDELRAFLRGSAAPFLVPELAR